MTQAGLGDTGITMTAPGYLPEGDPRVIGPQPLVTSTIGDPGAGGITMTDKGTPRGVTGGGGGGGGFLSKWRNMDPAKKDNLYQAMIAMGAAMMSTPGNFGEGLGAGLAAGQGVFLDLQERDFREGIQDRKAGLLEGATALDNRLKELQIEALENTDGELTWMGIPFDDLPADAQKAALTEMEINRRMDAGESREAILADIRARTQAYKGSSGNNGFGIPGVVLPDISTLDN